MLQGLRKLRALRWKPWALVGVAALAWWCYAAPINLTKRIRGSVEESLESGASSLITSRVDLARVNAQLSGDLRSVTSGHLDSEGFSHLLLHGWLAQQKQKGDAGRVEEAAAQDTLTPDNVPVHARYTRLYHVRYKDLNRFIANFWDANQVHEVVLTLQRKSVFHRWYVTGVTQFNVCAYDFDCEQISIADIQQPRR